MDTKMNLIKITTLNIVLISTLFANSSTLFQLRFIDINSFNFASFEERYNVEFQYCVADGICLFKNNSQEPTSELVNRLKIQEHALKEIKVYENYRMKAF